jgi:hypothetical protein
MAEKNANYSLLRERAKDRSDSCRVAPAVETKPEKRHGISSYSGEPVRLKAGDPICIAFHIEIICQISFSSL